ncbi:MAG: ferredoxin-thioredoxin reductase catalytic domain-containing protein [Candidatus Hodarchaeales archaeon]|jgi:ferredoxin-thioredoxin reductase catalytic subunit
MKSKKSSRDVESYVARIANRNNWSLNRNNDIRSDLVNGLLENINRLGYFNCPCRDSQENPRVDRDIICPCRYAQADIEEFGHCYCALYFDPNYDQKKPLKMIPERRP